MSARTNHGHRVAGELRRWTEDVSRFAKAHGWRVNSSPGAHSGFPQLVMIRSLPNGDRRVIFVRLLESDARLVGSQLAWLQDVDRVALLCHPHVAAYAWKPEDWPTVQEVLA